MKVDRRASMITTVTENIPEGFCEHAWNDIYPAVMILAYNGTMKGLMKDDGTNIVCCTDGIRPVVLKIDRINAG